MALADDIFQPRAKAASLADEIFRPDEEQRSLANEIFAPEPNTTAGDVAKSLAGGAVKGVGSTLQFGGNLVTQGINRASEKLTGKNPLLKFDDPLKGLAEGILESRTPGGKRAQELSTPTGSLTDLSTVSLGNAPTIGGYAQNLADVVGQFAVPLGVGAISKAAKLKAGTQIGIGAGLGAAQAGGAAISEEGSAIRDAKPEELAESSQTYRDYLAQGLSEAEARERTALDTEAYAGTIGAVPAGAEGAIIQGLLRGKLKLPTIGKGPVTRTASGAVTGGAGEAVQEVIEGAAAKLGANIGSGADQPLLEDSFANAILGFGGGAVAGGALANLRGREATPIPQPEPEAPIVEPAAAPPPEVPIAGLLTDQPGPIYADEGSGLAGIARSRATDEAQVAADAVYAARAEEEQRLAELKPQGPLARAASKVSPLATAALRATVEPAPDSAQPARGTSRDLNAESSPATQSTSASQVPSRVGEQRVLPVGSAQSAATTEASQAGPLDPALESGVLESELAETQAGAAAQDSAQRLAQTQVTPDIAVALAGPRSTTLTQQEITDATFERQEPESREQQRPGTEARGIQAVPSGRDRAEQGAEIQEAQEITQPEVPATVPEGIPAQPEGAIDERQKEGRQEAIPARQEVLAPPETPAQPDVTSDQAVPETKQEYSSTQTPLPGLFGARVKNIVRKLIAPEDIDPEHGLEDRPHITVKHGLETENAEDVRPLIESSPPVKARVTGIEIFEPKDKAYDIVVARVDSPDLAALNSRIKGALPNTETFPEYRPHITLGYVKKGSGQKYANAKTGLEGQELTLKTVEFSDRNENYTAFKLKGEKSTITQGVKPDIPAEAVQPEDDTETGQEGFDVGAAYRDDPSAANAYADAKRRLDNSNAQSLAQRFPAQSMAEDKRAQPERRMDAAKRKLVSEMSIEEARQALLVDELTNLGNRRAYDEAEKLKAQVSIDVDSLAAINDLFGHEAGDRLLKAVGEAVKAETEFGYRLGGDEFVVQAKTPMLAKIIMNRIVERLRATGAEYTAADGKVYEKTGIGVSYGVGKDLEAADLKLRESKAERERTGERAERKAKPVGLVEKPAQGRPAQVPPAAEEEVSEEEFRAAFPPKRLPPRERVAGDWYPRADERKAINAAFDRLVAEIKTKETDKGVALYSRSGAPEDTFAAETWRILAENNELFRYPRSESTTPEAIASDIDPGIRVASSPPIRGANYTKAWKITLPGTRGRLPQPSFIFENGLGEVWINVARLEEGSGGQKIYQIAGAYAHNTGKLFIGDPAGISDAGKLRRLENLIALSLKYGTTSFIRPHRDQGINWRTGDDTFNLQSMLDQSYWNVMASVPEMADIRYNFDSHRFEKTDGSHYPDSPAGIDTGTPTPKGLPAQDRDRLDTEPARQGPVFQDDAGARDRPGSERLLGAKRQRGRLPTDFKSLSDTRGAQSARAGVATLKRAAFTGSLLRERSEEGRRSILAEVLRQSNQQLDPPLKKTSYSTSETRPKGGFSVSEIRKLVAPIAAKWRAVSINVVQSTTDVPANATPSDVEGAYAGQGQVYLVADNLPTKERVYEVLAHEAIGHAAMEEMLGPDLMREVTRNVRAMERFGNKTLRELGGIVDERQPRLSQENRAMEIIALMAERGLYRDTPLWKRVVQAVKEFLRGLGVPWQWVAKQTEQDVFALLRSAEKYLQSGEQRALAGKPAAALASRAQAPTEFTPDAAEASAYRDGLRKVMASLRTNVAPITVGKAPRVLRALGAMDAPVTIARDVVRKATNKVLHNVPMSAIEQLPEELADPIAVFRSRTQQDALVVLTEHADANGRPVIVALDVRSHDGTNVINRIASIYGKDDARTRFKEWITDGNLVYKSNRAQGRSALRGLQLPNSNPDAQGLASRVLTELDVVNDAPLFSRSKQTETPEFRKWFGDSQVVDENGNPMVVYHGTADDFENFELDRPHRKDTGWLGRGFYFTNSADIANSYTNLKAGDTPNVMPVYLKIHNPYYATVAEKRRIQTLEMRGDTAAAQRRTDELRAAGHDGIILQYSHKEGGIAPVEYMVFDAEQIKSTGNRGTFDPENPNILYSRAGEAVDDAMRRFGMRRPASSSPFAAENARLREDDRTLWNKAKTFWKRQFFPGGLLPADVFKEKIARDNELEVVEFDVRHLVGRLERTIKRDYGMGAAKLPEATQELLSKALGGRVDPSIPADTRTAIITMRQYIDSLSRDYLGILQAQMDALVEEGSPEAAQKAGLLDIIANNIGQYVHRSYRAFDDPQWFSKIPDATVDAARSYLKSRYLEEGEDAATAARKAEASLNEIIKTGKAYDSMEAFIKESKLGAKDLSVLKRRKDIAPEIRALLGEHVDPRINFAKSATKMGRLIWNQRFLDRVREIGLGTFLFEGADRPPQATARIAAEGSEAYAPLNGLWTFPEVDQAFKDSLGKEKMGDFYRTVVQWNGMVKYGKTVLSPTTAFRNWQSAMFFALANGHFNMSHAAKSLSGLREYFTQQGEGARLDYLRKLKKLGVVYDTPYAGEMMRLLADSRIEDIIRGKSGTLLESVRTVNEYARSFYQFGDDFWKIIGFENEKRALMNVGFDDARAEKEAAERIRNTYPTYSMVGRGITALSRFPLVGTFVSFPAEIIRTSANMLRLVASDFKDPQLRPLAIKRALGMSMVAGFAYAVQEMTKAMFHVDDDDEEAVRELAAPWSKNSNFAFAGRDADGNLRYFDLSFLDPYNYWKRPITAIMRGQPWEDTATDIMVDTLKPFLGVDIAAGAIGEVIANKKFGGGRVYGEHDDMPKQLSDIAHHLRKDLQPGIVSNVERTLKALKDERSPSGKKYDLGDEIYGWVGWRATTLEPKTALYYRAFEFQDAKRDASKRLNDVLKNPNKVSDGDIRSAYEADNRQRADAYRAMALVIRAAQRSGMNAVQIRALLRRSNVSQQDIAALLNDRVPAITVTPASRLQTVHRARALYGAEKAQEISSRYQTLNAIIRETRATAAAGPTERAAR